MELGKERLNHLGVVAYECDRHESVLDLFGLDGTLSALGIFDSGKPGSRAARTPGD